MESYDVLGNIGEGAHGLVLDAIHILTQERVALKKINVRKLGDGIPIAVFREIKCLQALQHENIVTLRESFAHSCSVVLAFDHLPNDLQSIIADQRLKVEQIKGYITQLCKAIEYMHGMGIMHRDLKPANLLIDYDGRLKVADLGQSRLCHNDSQRPYSHQVSTRWYRAPELLYGSRHYTRAIDMWSVGCIIAELFNKSPICPGENDIEQLVCVFRLLGSPTSETWPTMTTLPDYGKIDFPHYDGADWEATLPRCNANSLDLIRNLLIYDSDKRLTASDVLCHDYMYTLPLACNTKDMPRPHARHPNPMQQAMLNYEF